MTPSQNHRPLHQGHPDAPHATPHQQRGALYPNRGWAARAARELGYTAAYISRLASGKAQSPAAEAALNEWKQLNHS